MKKFFSYLLAGSLIIPGLLPLVAQHYGYLPDKLWPILLGLNGLAWLFATALLLARQELRGIVTRLARQFGIDGRLKSFEHLANSLLSEVERKNNALMSGLLERKIASREELSRTLERIVAHAYKLLKAESAELALFDKELGLYHSSLVLGKPFRKSAQAMLSGALAGEDEEDEVSPDVLIQPLAFGGDVLGSLRVGLPRGFIPSVADKEIMSLLALQGGLAIINSRYTEELVRMKRVSEESVKIKTGFLANLSHEIRGPLGIMLNAVELVIDGLCGPVSKDQLETLRMVKDNGEHLLELINDVLDYAKVESGKLTPQKVEVVVNDLLKDITSVVRAQADAKLHSLNCKSCDEVLTIRVDRRHMRQMLINMLTNAIKYTPDKGTIEVWAERIPGSKIKVNVKDTGVGIEAAERYKVFSPFERVQNAYSINQVGTGLGMPLTKRLAEVNGGIIDFDSMAGKGSHFWLVFPAAEYNPATIVQEKKENGEPKGMGELILLVEPENGERAMLIRYLSHIGFRVAAATNKVEALQFLREQKIDLAIIDNSAIDNQEEDLVKEIRENTKSTRLPLVLLSSRAFIFDIEKYLKIGIDRCLSKPVSLKELGTICRQLLDGDADAFVQDGVTSTQSNSNKAREIDSLARRTGSHRRVLRADDRFH